MGNGKNDSIIMTKHVVLKNFDIPKFVNEDSESSDIVPLEDLSWEVLDKLCNRFRTGVFKTANKIDSKGG